MTSSPRESGRIWVRVRDYILYILIGFSFMAITFAVELNWGRGAFIRWGGLAVFTAIVFGLFIRASRSYFRQWHFWALTGVLLCIHLGGFVVVLIQVPGWRLMWFMIMALEYPVLLLLRDRIVGQGAFDSQRTL